VLDAEQVRTDNSVLGAHFELNEDARVLAEAEARKLAIESPQKKMVNLMRSVHVQATFEHAAQSWFDPKVSREEASLALTLPLAHSFILRSFVHSSLPHSLTPSLISSLTHCPPTEFG
jgi:hypothetical protein